MDADKSEESLINLNILSAIINESYESVRNFLNDDSQKYHITPDNEFVQRNFNFIIKMKLNLSRLEPPPCMGCAAFWRHWQC